MISLQATVTVTDLHSGPAGFTLVSVTSSEPDSGIENGDVPNDIQNWVAGTPDVVGQLRAERSGGNGGTYTLTYEGNDLANNKARCTTTVSAPKNQGGVAAAADHENQQFEDAFIDPLPAPVDTTPTPAPDNSNGANPEAGTRPAQNSRCTSSCR